MMRILAALPVLLALTACSALQQPPAEYKPEIKRIKSMTEFTVIAHRGASGYLPEHTLEAVAMGHKMGADYIEQDVVLTADGELIVLHDLYLDAVTDVAERFPGRARRDGRHYAIDFTLEEIRSLRVGERLEDNGKPRFPGRFPSKERDFRVPTLDEEIRLIQDLNRSTGKDVGIYLEPKSIAWHGHQGADLLVQVLTTLKRHGYHRRDHRAYLQSFEFPALQRARSELGTDLKLVQLIGSDSWDEFEVSQRFLRSRKGLEKISALVDGIGPWIPYVIDINKNTSPDISTLTSRAQAFGMFVHAFTLRADELPHYVDSLDQFLELLILNAGLDGLFTDHPDQVLHYLKSVN
jgi:glycerophosphoryl diester phosphodiesterase